LASPGERMYMTCNKNEIKVYGTGSKEYQLMQEVDMIMKMSNNYFNNEILKASPDTFKLKMLTINDELKKAENDIRQTENLPALNAYIASSREAFLGNKLSEFKSFRDYMSRRNQEELPPLPAGFIPENQSYLNEWKDMTAFSSVSRQIQMDLHKKSASAYKETQILEMLDEYEEDNSSAAYQVFFSMYMTKAIQDKNFLIGENVIQKFKQDVIPDFITGKILKDYQNAKNQFLGLKIPDGANLTQNLETSGDSLLSQIIEKHRGKTLYFDIWATWCGPCIGEFKFAKEFHEKLDKDKVQVVYLAGHSKENTWKATIAEHGLLGDHYLLNIEQYEQIAKKFESQGFPHYAIVDGEGNIRSKSAPRPSIRQAELNTNLVQTLNEM